MTPEEVNCFLAEELMGWELNADKSVWLERIGLVTMAPIESALYWNPYHNIAQALGDGGKGTVVGRMREKFMLRMEVGFAESGFGSTSRIFVKFTSLETPFNSYWEIADTPAAAITLAACEALKAECKRAKYEPEEDSFE